MAIYIGTKRIDGGGSSDPSIVRIYYPDNIDASNINDLGIGLGGDPSTLVCYSILALDKYYLINAAIYK